MRPARICNCIVLFFVVSLALNTFAANGANGAKASPISATSQVEQTAAYWTSEPGWDTELQLKNNLASAPLDVTPVLLTPSGQEISLAPINIPANGSVSFSVSSGLQDRAPNLVGKVGSYGSVVFRFQGSDAMNLHVTAVPSMTGSPAAFRLRGHVAAPLSSKDQGTLEGIW